MYTPLYDQCAASHSPCKWLKQIITLPERGEAAELALKALALTRLGHVTRNDSMIRQGNISYGGALQSVQKGLWRTDMMMADDLFLAGYMLVIYEVSPPGLLPMTTVTEDPSCMNQRLSR